MKQTLRQYSQSNNISYIKSWRKFRDGGIQGAYKDEKGNIIVELPDAQPVITNGDGQAMLRTWASVEPLEVSDNMQISHGTSRSRTNRSANISPNKRFDNIRNSFNPVNSSSHGGSNSSEISIQEMAELTQKSYWNFPECYNLVNIATEFCTNNIYLTGGTEKSKNFFDAWLKRIGAWGLQDRFYREYWRSGNVFLFKLPAEFKAQDLAKLTQIYGLSTAAKKVNIPIKYIILNPVDLIAGDSAAFSTTKYYKSLNGYEISQFRNKDASEETKQLFNSLPPDIQKKIKSGDNTQVLMPLDTEKLITVFLRKQDYEAFGVSIIWPVLDDLDWLSELIRMDRAIARTCQQAVLLVTTGYQDKEGRPVINPKAVTDLQTIFANESIGRVLIHDFSTKAEFVIPQIGDILDPKKYAIVRDRIRLGLNDILIGGDEKFANASIKVQVFVERLKNAQQAFLNEFLIPEVKKIAKELKFKTYPTPYYEEVNLRDQVQFARIYTQLAQYGILTPEETIEAIESGRLPEPDESVESQKKLKGYKKEELYEPIAPKKDQEGDGMNGRPPGSKTPQSTKNVKPIGTPKTQAEITQYFSVKKIADNLILAQKLENKVKDAFKVHYKLKELNKDQETISSQLTQVIIANENPAHWTSSIKSYIKNP